MENSDIRKIVGEELARILKERDQGTLIVPKKQHYDHHKKIKEWISNEDEWLANHNFTSSMRENVGTVRKAGFWSATAAVVSFIIAAVIYFIRHGGK